MFRIFESGRLLLRQTHRRTCRGGRGSNYPPSFQDLGKIQIFRAVPGKYLGKTNNFSGSDMKNLGKVRSFRALTLNNCKNQLPNLGEDFFFFFLENTLILGRKLKNIRDHHDFKMKFLLRPRSQTIFLSYL